LEAFTRLEARGVPLLVDDIDTDMIFPAQYAKTIETSGLGKYLFARERRPGSGPDVAGFPLDRPEHAGAEILLTGRNFGCGSSREHAVWALRDFGFRCIIAESFSDIFYANCFRNGVLPVALPRDVVGALSSRAETEPDTVVTVDLREQTVEAPNFGSFRFSVEPHRKRMLLEGLDEVGLTLKEVSEIEAYETRRFAAEPWLVRTHD